MTLKVYDFLCNSCGHQFEQFVRTNTLQLTCPKCTGSTAVRVPGLVKFQLEGITGHFPTALQKWEDRHTPKDRK